MQTKWLWAALWVSSFSSVSLAHPESGSEGYHLDTLERVVPGDGPMRCPKVPLVVHEGSNLRWKTPIKIYEGFQPSIVGLEALIAKVATRIYGRPPTLIRHLGSYNCRRIRLYPTLLSEHGLGNAIDVEGFEFSVLSAAERASSSLPKKLQRAFTTTILEHWEGPETGRTEHEKSLSLHRRFWRELADELAARPDLFRVVLGPSYPGHKNHLHLDMAPYRLVDY